MEDKHPAGMPLVHVVISRRTCRRSERTECCQRYFSQRKMTLLAHHDTYQCSDFESAFGAFRSSAIFGRIESVSGIWRWPKLKPGRQFDRSGELLPIRRTLFQIDVLRPRNDIEDSVTMGANEAAGSLEFATGKLPVSLFSGDVRARPQGTQLSAVVRPPFSSSTWISLATGVLAREWPFSSRSCALLHAGFVPFVFFAMYVLHAPKPHPSNAASTIPDPELLK